MSTLMPLGVTYAVNSLASTNAALIIGRQAQLTNGVLNNASAAAKWVRFYNKATAPVPGTDIPVAVIALPASGSVQFYFGEGLQFNLGLGIAITGAAPANDATAVAAGDVQVALTYI
jgi:hypothetical protein